MTVHKGSGSKQRDSSQHSNHQKVSWPSRSVDSGNKVLDSLKRKFPKLDAEVWYLDHMEVKSIKAFVERARVLGKVDVLLNNARPVEASSERCKES